MLSDGLQVCVCVCVFACITTSLGVLENYRLCACIFRRLQRPFLCSEGYNKYFWGWGLTCHGFGLDGKAPVYFCIPPPRLCLHSIPTHTQLPSSRIPSMCCGESKEVLRPYSPPPHTNTQIAPSYLGLREAIWNVKDVKPGNDVLSNNTHMVGC